MLYILEDFLVNTANKKDFFKQPEEVNWFFRDDLQSQLLVAQVHDVGSNFASTAETVTFSQWITYLC